MLVASWMHASVASAQDDWGQEASAETDGGDAPADAGQPTVDAVKKAAAAFDAGRANLKLEEYDVAASNFERADALVQNPRVLLLAIQAREAAGHLARAATLAALAMQRYPDDARFESTQELVRRAMTELSKVKVTCAEPCTLLIGTRIVHGQPNQKRFLFLDSGDYQIRAAFEGDRSSVQSYRANAGESGALHFDSPERAPASDYDAKPGFADPPSSSSDGFELDMGKPDEPTSGLPPAVFWSSVAVTGVLAGVSTWSGIDTQNNPGPDRIKAECTREEGSDCALYQEGLDKQTRTNVLWGVTAGAAVISAVIGAAFTDWSDDDKTAKSGPGLKPWLNIADGEYADAVSVGASGRF